jgi:acetophenone carboxylase
MLGTDVLFCCAPSTAEIEIARSASDDAVQIDCTSQPRIAAGLEAVRQWQADASEPVIAAALSGPATVVRALRDGGADASDEALFEQAGRSLAALARAFCEVGVHLLQWCETVVPDGTQLDHWNGALGTAGNVARFHRAAPVLVLDAPQTPAWPPQAVACPTLDQHAGSMPRPHGRAWLAQPSDWPSPSGDTASERVVLTRGEVPAATEIATLLAEVRRVRGR